MATVHSKKTVPNNSVAEKSVVVDATSNKTTLTQKPIKSVQQSDNSQRSSQTRIEEVSSQEICEIYSMLLPCLHLRKVMSSQAKEMVMKTYKVAMNIVIAKIKSAHSFHSKYLDRNGRKMNTKMLQKLISTTLKCKDCKENKCTSHKRVFMCLQCTNIGCFSAKHAYMHAKKTGHIFGMFQNYLYSSLFEHLLILTSNRNRSIEWRAIMFQMWRLDLP